MPASFPSRVAWATALGFLLMFTSAGCRKDSVVVPESHAVKGPGQRKLIVFVHGVIGDMDNTWINPVTHASWPGLIAGDTDFKDFDVFVYGYYSPPTGKASDIEEIANRFRQQMKDWKMFANYEEIDFITHSMGGIITKRMLNTMNTPAESANLHRIHCVIYLSVPSNGAEVASLASWISRNPQFQSMSPSGAADFLQAVEGDWGAVLRERKPSAPFPLSFSAYEKLNTYGVSIVPRLFVSQLGDAEPVAFDYDHSGIVKPKDLGSDVYSWVKARILESSAHPVADPDTDIRKPLYPAHVKPFPAFGRPMCTGDLIPKGISVTVSLGGDIDGPYPQGPIAPADGKHYTYVLVRGFAEPHTLIESRPWGGGFTVTAAPKEDYEICVQLPDDAIGIKNGHISVHDVRDK